MNRIYWNFYIETSLFYDLSHKYIQISWKNLKLFSALCIRVYFCWNTLLKHLVASFVRLARLSRWFFNAPGPISSNRASKIINLCNRTIYSLQHMPLRDRFYKFWMMLLRAARPTYDIQQVSKSILLRTDIFA